ncbi:MAG: magnesium/cobalt transporter CorA [Phycisphaeraceae bacterium]|nr:magnesium/cobalt transporter CorA [Phycisphaeraceae bacterium]
MSRGKPIKLGRAIGGAIDNLVSSVLTLPGLGHKPHQKRRHTKPGARPGIESHEEMHVQPSPQQAAIHVIEYDRQSVRRRDVTLDELPGFLAEPEPADISVRWINVDGLHAWVVQRFREAFGYHTLEAEDVLHVPQRPKVEREGGRLFIITRMTQLLEAQQLTSEQVSLFMHGKTVVTFQERAGDVWDPIRQRIDTAGTRLRGGGPDYLVYALLDAIVDHGFPILEHYGDQLETLERRILKKASPQELAHINAIKRELSLLRRVMWPMREMLAALSSEQTSEFNAATRMFLRDVHEHSVQIVDLVETFREMASGLTDLHMSVISNRMNEVMKVLTIIATLFIPITFLAGIYGMNFEHIPELHLRYAYPAFWVLCILITSGLLIYFWRKGWLGR